MMGQNDRAVSRRRALSGLGLTALAALSSGLARAADRSTFQASSLFPYRPIVDHPKFAWPNGARIAVWVVPNIEHFHLELGPGAPDVRNYSRRDYGNRVGVFRLMDVLAKHKVPGTVALNAEVVRYYPRVIEEAKKLNWEFMGHGLTNSTTLAGMTPETERATIAAVREVVTGLGQPMKGWLGPGLTETWNTLDFLKDAGVEYVCDWVNDDLPYKLNNGIYAIPYTLELNDIPLFNEPSVTPEHFEQRIRDAFDVLYAEGAVVPRVMCIALHPFLIGSPHRIKYLDNALRYIAGHKEVWFARGGEIIDAYKKAAT